MSPNVGARLLARGATGDAPLEKCFQSDLCPGPTVTPGLEGLATDDTRDALIDTLKAQTVLGRLADPAETAAVALILASDESSFMTGSEVFVDGGSAQV
ncbi:SDR family oxidoreductase [Pendulispora albinea]|uniref:SDR family oxidoreductase n=1 Tax=Pendulispora albinea TaxID=2741071 RepID=A0ABZ2M770_9BACT